MPPFLKMWGKEMFFMLMVVAIAELCTAQSHNKLIHMNHRTPQSYPYGDSSGDTKFFSDGWLNISFQDKQRQFTFLDRSSYSSLKISSNGLIGFGEKSLPCCSSPSFKNITSDSFAPLLAVFWGSTDLEANDAAVFFRMIDHGGDEVLQDGRDMVNGFLTPEIRFQPSYGMLVTWDNVTFAGGNHHSPTNTYQLMLLSDGRSTYAIIKYLRMTWTVSPLDGGNSSGLCSAKNTCFGPETGYCNGSACWPLNTTLLEPSTVVIQLSESLIHPENFVKSPLCTFGINNISTFDNMKCTSKPPELCNSTALKLRAFPDDMLLQLTYKTETACLQYPGPCTQYRVQQAELTLSLTDVSLRFHVQKDSQFDCHYSKVHFWIYCTGNPNCPGKDEVRLGKPEKIQLSNGFEFNAIETPSPTGTGSVATTIKAYLLNKNFEPIFSLTYTGFRLVNNQCAPEGSLTLTLSEPYFYEKNPPTNIEYYMEGVCKDQYSLCSNDLPVNSNAACCFADNYEKCGCQNKKLGAENPPDTFQSYWQQNFVQNNSVQCGENAEFNSSGSSCPATCYSPSSAKYCIVPNESGCFCKDGYIRDLNGECVAEDKCGCADSMGNYYMLGQNWTKGNCEQFCQCIQVNVGSCNGNQSKIFCALLPPCPSLDFMCKVLPGGKTRTCYCKDGFTEHQGTCVRNDNCANITCKKGGTCINTPDSFICKCSKGFKGKYCNSTIPVCTLPGICQNGGSCDIVTKVTSNKYYNCTCAPGFTGANCESLVGPEKPEHQDFKSNNEMLGPRYNSISDSYKDETKYFGQFDTTDQQENQCSTFIIGHVVSCKRPCKLLNNGTICEQPTSSTSTSTSRSTPTSTTTLTTVLPNTVTTMIPMTSSTAPPPPVNCNVSSLVMDIGLMIDWSAGITNDEYQILVNYLSANFVPSISISQTASRVAVFTYDEALGPVYSLSSGTTLANVQGFLSELLTYRHSSISFIYIGGAMFYNEINWYTPSFGDRWNTPDILFIFASQNDATLDLQSAITQAQAYRGAGIHVVIIAVGPKPTLSQLGQLAWINSAPWVISINNATDYAGLTAQMHNAMCAV